MSYPGKMVPDRKGKKGRGKSYGEWKRDYDRRTSRHRPLSPKRKMPKSK